MLTKQGSQMRVKPKKSKVEGLEGHGEKALGFTRDA
jgi:hypothetical protein